jgi:hypothetical protein
MIVSERLAVSCILDSWLPSSLIDKVNVITPELVLCGFIVCLDTEGAHGDLRGRMASAPHTNKTGIFPVARLGDV